MYFETEVGKRSLVQLRRGLLADKRKRTLNKLTWFREPWPLNYQFMNFQMFLLFFSFETNLRPFYLNKKRNKVMEAFMD
jgi:hypothetical protein